jgi:hypothetical protein
MTHGSKQTHGVKGGKHKSVALDGTKGIPHRRPREYDKLLRKLKGGWPLYDPDTEKQYA